MMGVDLRDDLARVDLMEEVEEVEDGGGDGGGGGLAAAATTWRSVWTPFRLVDCSPLRPK